jgi:predicted component of type VI protein secretion system
VSGNVVGCHSFWPSPASPQTIEEILVGRKSTKVNPNVDLSDFDAEKRISRRHVVLFMRDGLLFMRNESRKNTVHLNRDPVLCGECVRVRNGDKVILSGFIGLQLLPEPSRKVLPDVQPPLQLSPMSAGAKLKFRER